MQIAQKQKSAAEKIAVANKELILFFLPFTLMSALEMQRLAMKSQFYLILANGVTLFNQKIHKKLTNG